MIKAKYYPRPLYNLEAYMLIQDIVNEGRLIVNDSDSGIIKDVAKDIKKDIEDIKKDLDIKEISLFTNFKNAKASIASCLLESFIKIKHIDEDDFIDQVLKAIDDFFTKPLSTIALDTHLEMTYDQKDSDALNELLKLKLDDHDKLALISALHKPKETLEKIFKELAPISARFEILTKKYADELTKEIDQDVIEFIFRNVNYRYDGILDIIPSLYKYDSIITTIDDDDGDITLYLGIAINLDEIKNFDFYDDMDQRIEYFLKAINDRSKMKIIEILKEKEAYNAQLAEALNLKAPTISHHIDQMLNAGIISARRVNDRTYYRFNKEKCLLIIDNLRKKFE